MNIFVVVKVLMFMSGEQSSELSFSHELQYAGAVSLNRYLKTCQLTCVLNIVIYLC